MKIVAQGSADTLATIYQITLHHAPGYCCLEIIIESNGIFLVTPVELLSHVFD
jgi:hypothetical protein